MTKNLIELFFTRPLPPPMVLLAAWQRQTCADPPRVANLRRGVLGSRGGLPGAAA